MPSFRSIRLSSFRRVETVIFGVALLFVAAAILFAAKGNGVESEIEALDGRVARASTSLRTLQEESNIEGLETQLAALQAVPVIDSLPTELRALQLDSAVFDRASRVDATITGFTSRAGTILLAGEELATLEYVIQAQGPEPALTGLLRVLEDFPSSVVRDLDYTIQGKDWSFILTIAVVHQSNTSPEEGEPATS